MLVCASASQKKLEGRCYSDTFSCRVPYVKGIVTLTG